MRRAINAIAMELYRPPWKWKHLHWRDGNPWNEPWKMEKYLWNLNGPLNGKKDPWNLNDPLNRKKDHWKWKDTHPMKNKVWNINSEVIIDSPPEISQIFLASSFLTFSRPSMCVSRSLKSCQRATSLIHICGSNFPPLAWTLQHFCSHILSNSLKSFSLIQESSWPGA